MHLATLRTAVEELWDILPTNAVPKCSSQSFPHKVEDVLPAKVRGGSKDGGWVYTDPEAGSQNGNSRLEESFRKKRGENR